MRKMKCDLGWTKTPLLSLAALCLALAAGLSWKPGVLTARAETSYGGSDWTVTFTAGENPVLDSNFKTQDLVDVVTGLQPGDTAVIVVNLKNENDSATDWYMTNEVLSSLEESVDNAGAAGGAYTYILDYTDKDGVVNTLFSSDTVGGEQSEEDIENAGEGLHEATDSLENYFYLDTLEKGESGSVTLQVSLDGETQGNAYQDTWAQLQMNFAVELSRNAPASTTNTTTPSETPSPSSPSSAAVESHIAPVQTGDESLPLPLLIGLTVAGATLMAFALVNLRRNRKEGKE